MLDLGPICSPNRGPIKKKLHPITWPRFPQIQDSTGPSSPTSPRNKSKSKKLKGYKINPTSLGQLQTKNLIQQV